MKAQIFVVVGCMAFGASLFELATKKTGFDQTKLYTNWRILFVFVICSVSALLADYLLSHGYVTCH
jgi:hypothetical protein